MNTAAAVATYRKTKTGQWVAFGPVSTVKTGIVSVTKRDGVVKMESVLSVGHSFSVDGVECCYGYLAATRTTSAPAYAASAPARRQMCDECGERSATVAATDLSGIRGRVCRSCAASGDLSFA